MTFYSIISKKINQIYPTHLDCTKNTINYNKKQQQQTKIQNVALLFLIRLDFHFHIEGYNMKKLNSN